MNHEKIVEAVALEKVVLNVLKKENPGLMENYWEVGEGGRRAQYDAIVSEMLNLSAFGKESIHADKIVVEIKAGRAPTPVLRSFINRVENEFDAIVFILATSKPKSSKNSPTSEKSNVHFLYNEDLEHNSDVKEVLHNLDEYIMRDDNIIIEDYYPLLKQTSNDLSFAIGAGCSKASHISDWNTLSEALGYELLYDIIDTKESKYRNKVIAEKLNDSIFSCFDKNSALDAIHNSYVQLPATGQRNYWKTIKNVLYMNYDSPNDAKQPLVDAIVDCIKRKNIDTIINYNFDSVLEQNIDPRYKSDSKEVQSSITQLIGCEICHVHGYIPYDYNGKVDVSNFVFTDKDYYENMSNPNNFCNKRQTTILQNKNVIFVGVSFTDSNMKEILRKRVERGYKNVVFAFFKLPSFDVDGINSKLIINKYKLIQNCYFDSLGVKILWVDNFDEIPKQINQI